VDFLIIILISKVILSLLTTTLNMVKGIKRLGRKLRKRSGKGRRRGRGSKGNGSKAFQPGIVATKTEKEGRPMKLDFNLPSATIAAQTPGVVINRACLLSMIINGGSTGQTVYGPVYDEVRITGLVLTMPASLSTAAAVPTAWAINLLGDDGPNEEIIYKNESSVASSIRIPLPSGSRLVKPCRALIPNSASIEGIGAFYNLAENLFMIRAIGVSEINSILTVEFVATPGFGSPAIITATAGTGQIGNTVMALDCIEPSAAVPPTFVVGPWLITPIMPAIQCQVTKPAAFARTLG